MDHRRFYGGTLTSALRRRATAQGEANVRSVSVKSQLTDIAHIAQAALNRHRHAEDRHHMSETQNPTPAPNLTGAAYLTTIARDHVARAKARVAAATERVNSAVTRHAQGCGQLEGVAAALEQEAAALEDAVKEMLPGSNGGPA